MKSPYPIGIAGGTCSGKSTLAVRLKERLKTEGASVVVFHMDRYFKPVTPTTIAPITRREYVEHNHPDSLRLDELYRDFGKALEGDADVVIVEGLFALMLDALREHYQFKIFVDLRSDERMARRIKRNLAANMGNYDDIVDRYLDTVRFRHDELVEPTRWHADLVLNGNLDAHRGIDAALAYVRDALKA